MSNVIEAAARAYCRVANIPQDRWHVATERVEAVLAAVEPLIEAAALERAAKVAEDYDKEWSLQGQGDNIAAAIRALKEQP